MFLKPWWQLGEEQAEKDIIEYNRVPEERAGLWGAREEMGAFLVVKHMNEAQVTFTVH